MIIVYAVDAHGNELSVRKLIKVFKELSADFLILGGDLSFSLNLLKDVDKYAIITGECDDIYMTKHAKELNVLFDGNVLEIYGVKMGFIGGLSVHQSLRRLMGRYNGYLDVLVTHFPPKGCLDLILSKYHAGLVEVLDIVLKYGVKYVLTGHYHDNVGICRLGSALVINPGPLMFGKYLLISNIKGALDIQFCTL